MKIEQYIVGPVMTNCYFIINEKTNELIVLDPGESGEKLADFAKKSGYHPVAVLLTHGHYDHMDGLDDFLAAYEGESIPVYIGENEKETLTDCDLNRSEDMGNGARSYHADIFLKDGQKFSLAGFQIEALFTPGHTPGGMCYYIPEEHTLFSGDSLFAGSIGRTDFPGGSFETLIKSVKEKCLSLPDDTKVLPGHEGTSTIGTERKYNPFLQAGGFI